MAGVSSDAVERHLRWLERERLILGFGDCRTPHQRFAAIVLNQVLAGQDTVGQQHIGRMIDAVLIDPQNPLVGLRTLLHELRFGIGEFRWSRLPERSAIETVATRCWQAQGKDRGFAALVLSELWKFVDDGLCVVIDPYAETLSRWISNPDDGAYGFAHLLNDLSHEVKPTAEAIVGGVDPTPIACAYSNVSVESAYGLADLMRTLCSLDSGFLKEKMKTDVDSARLLEFSGDQRLLEEGYVFGRFCSSVMYWDEDLALEMAERFCPIAQAALARDAIWGFGELSHEFLMTVLRVFDPLGGYVGKLKPDRRRWSIARRICRVLDPEVVAGRLSDLRIRDFQTSAGFLYFLFRCLPKKYDSVVARLDWLKLDQKITRDLSSPSHETEALLCSLSLSDTSRSLVSDFIALRADRILEMPPRRSCPVMWCKSVASVAVSGG